MTSQEWPLWGIAHGHGALVVCAVLYLIWWCLFFDPNRESPKGALRIFGIACIIGAAAAGIWGVYRIVDGMGLIQDAVEKGQVVSSALPGWVFVVGLVVVYAVALLVTTKAFHRQVTTELLLIVGWLALELAVINCLAGPGILSVPTLVVLLVLVVALFAASMVCYVLYYNLDAFPGFIDGCVPLIAVGVFSLVLTIVLSV